MSRLEINSDVLIDPALLDFSRTCRLCLQQATELSPLFPETEPSEAAVSSLPSKIMACVSIEVLPEHNTMPKQVCLKCVQQIDSWVKFKELCESANSLLQQCLANLQPSSTDDAETLHNNLQGPDTILSDVDVSIFERDSLFGALEEGSMPLSDDFNVSFSEYVLNQKIQSTLKKTMIGNTSTPKRLNENGDNDGEVCKNILANKIENFNSKDNEEKPESPKGPSKWKLKYDECYKKSYPCDICKKEFSKFTRLINHDRVEHHDRLNNFTCDVCGMLFVSQSRIDIHMLRHRGKTFECLECHKMFVSKKSLSIHMRSHDPNNKFKCSFCEVVRASQRMLDDHVRGVHTKEALFRCELCGREFTTKQSKDVHYARHVNKKLFKCNVCDSSFINHNSYKSHIEKHSTLNAVICSICGKLLKNNHSLNQHMRSHSDKNFKCLLCSSSFSQKYLLVRHEATHLNLHPFKCNICHKEFKRKDLLSLHTRRHTGDKRYSCDECSGSFFTLQSLKTHKCSNTKNSNKSFMNFVNEPAEKITVTVENVMMIAKNVSN